MVTPYISAHSRVGYGRETAYGTQATITRSFGINHQGIELPDVTIEAKQYRNLGTKRKYYATRAGRRERAGNLVFLPTVGEFFYYVFGTDSFAAGTPNVHTITTQNGAILPSFTLGAALEGDDNWLRSYTGCVVNSANFSMSEAGEFSCSAEIKAQDVKDASNTSPSLFSQPAPASTTPFMFYDLTSNISIGGATFATVNSFNWGINNNLKTKHFIQSSNAQDPFVYTNGYPDFSLGMDITPRGFASSDTDAIYHLLEDDQTLVDITIALRQSATNIISVTFDDCLLSAAPHNLPEDGNEVTTSVTANPTNITVSVSDSIAVYSGL